MDKVFTWGKKVVTQLESVSQSIRADLASIPEVRVYDWELLAPADQTAIVNKLAALGFEEA